MKIQFFGVKKQQKDIRSLTPGHKNMELVFFPDLYMQNHQPLGSAMWSGHRSHRTSSAYPGLQLAKDGVPLGIRQQYLAVFSYIFWPTFFGQPCGNSNACQILPGTIASYKSADGWCQSPQAGAVLKPRG